MAVDEFSAANSPTTSVSAGEYPIVIEGLDRFFGEQTVHDGSGPQGEARRNSRRGRRIGHRQVGADAIDHRLAAPDAGQIEVFGQSMTDAGPRTASSCLTHTAGVALFQGGALFSS